MAETLVGVRVASLEESAEMTAAMGAHAAVPDAHHTTTTSFTELVDLIGDAQIPSTITRDTELVWSLIASKPAGFADKVDDDTLKSLFCLPGQIVKASKGGEQGNRA